MSKEKLETIPEKFSPARKIVIVSLMIIGFSLFIVGGALGVSRVNDPKVVVGEPRLSGPFVTSPTDTNPYTDIKNNYSIATSLAEPPPVASAVVSPVPANEKNVKKSQPKSEKTKKDD